jgi:hypothetical protein
MRLNACVILRGRSTKISIVSSGFVAGDGTGTRMLSPPMHVFVDDGAIGSHDRSPNCRALPHVAKLM